MRAVKGALRCESAAQYRACGSGCCIGGHPSTRGNRGQPPPIAVKVTSADRCDLYLDMQRRRQARHGSRMEVQTQSRLTQSLGMACNCRSIYFASHAANATNKIGSFPNDAVLQACQKQKDVTNRVPQSQQLQVHRLCQGMMISYTSVCASRI